MPKYNDKNSFQGNKILNDNEYCTFLSIELLDSVVRMQICNKKEKDNK